MQNFACSLDEILQKGYYLVSSSYSNFCVRARFSDYYIGAQCVTETAVSLTYYSVLCNSLSLTAGDSEKLHRLRWNITASGRWRLLSKLNCTQFAISELPNKPASLTQCLKHNHLINTKMSLCGFPWKLYFHEKMSAWNNFEKENIIIVFRKWFCLIGSALSFTA